jgi:hypothetical protein
LAAGELPLPALGPELEPPTLLALPPLLIRASGFSGLDEQASEASEASEAKKSGESQDQGNGVRIMAYG